MKTFITIVVYLCLMATMAYMYNTTQTDIAENKHSDTKLRQEVLDNEKKIKNSQEDIDGLEGEMMKISSSTKMLIESVFNYEDYYY